MTPAELASLQTAIQQAIVNGFNTVAAGLSPPAPPTPPTTPAPATTPIPPPPPPTSGGGSPTLPPPAVNVAQRSIIDTQNTLFTSLINGSEIAISTAGKIFDHAAKTQEKFSVIQYRNLIKLYGAELRKVSSEEFKYGNFSKIKNEGEKAFAESYRSMLDYGVKLVKFEGLGLEELASKRANLVNDFADTNINLLLKSNAAIEEQSLIFSNALGLDIEKTSDLMSISFAETGEVTSDILTQITNQAESVGKAVGMPIKRMVEGIYEIKSDMETFTDVTIESAAKMAASLSQLGLTLSSFKGLMTPFRDFDSAATKMGDMSAMFGVQMDAMEMMYLANEDEEQFLHKMREQLLDQGLDVESMSKTRQRALADQLGMSVKEMKMFMSTGQQFADMTDLQVSSQEGAAKSQSEALNTLNDNMIISSKTTAELKGEQQNLNEAFSSPALSNYLENVGRLQGEITKATTGTSSLGKQIIDVNSATYSGLEKLSGVVAKSGGKIIEQIAHTFNESANQSRDGITNLIDTLGGLAGIGPAATTQVAAGGAAANSWPKMFEELAASFAVDKDGNPHLEQTALYKSSVEYWGDLISESIRTSIEKINQSANFDVVINKFRDASDTITNISSNFSSAASIAPSNSIDVRTQQLVKVEIDSINLTEKLSSSIEILANKINEKEVKVDVSVDIEQIKQDIVETIKQGFKDANYNFDMTIDKTQIATVIASSRTSNGKKFQMVANE